MSPSRESFFTRVHVMVSEIPAGRVATYGQIASLLGQDRGARAVGWALRALRGVAAARVPWHRVVGAEGRISLPDGLGGAEQRKRLRAEGVRFAGRRVDLARHGFWTAFRRRPSRG